jgi:hypothetical protein
MRVCLPAALVTAVLLINGTFPASAAGRLQLRKASAPFTIQVSAATIATLTVTMNRGAEVICNPGTAHTGIVACTNTVNLTGNIRSTRGGTGTLMVTIAPVIGAAGNILDVTALTISCADNSSTGTHDAATFASAVRLASAGAQCASWSGQNIFRYNVNLSFGIDARQAKADTYPLSNGWTISATAT